MRVLVTGITGFIGSHVAEELRNRGYEVLGTVRQAEKVAIAEYELIYCENIFTATEDDLVNITQNVDAVIHCAWYVNHNDYLISPYNIDAAIGTTQLAKASIKSGIKHFIGIGSCFEYDLSSSMPLSNKSPLRPNTVYGHAKVAAYHNLKAIFLPSNIRYNWARLFYVYGDGEPKTKLYSYIKNQIISNEVIKLGPCEIYRDYIHVDLAAKQIVDLISSDNVGDVNICTGTAIKLKDFAMELAKTLNGQHLVEFSENTVERPNNETPVIYGKL